MFKQKLLLWAGAVLLAFGTTSMANETSQPAPQAQTQAEVAMPNFFDPNYWFGGATATPATASTELTFNAAHPGAWMKWVDPKSHTTMHMQFANPANYAQFMQPQFFMEFMKPENMAAWMDFSQYAVLMNPQTWTYWMNPAAYQHVFDPKMYVAATNPASYMAYMNPATYMGWAAPQGSVESAETVQ